MRVLIAGCGYVGSRLGRRLARDEGHEVWGLRRSPADLPAPIRPLEADLLAPDLAERLPAVDRVVYAASADASSPGPYRAAYVDGVRNLLSALGDGPDRFVFVSSTAVYGDSGGGWVDEETPVAPTSFRGEIMLEGEELVRDSARGGVVLRLGGIYGPGRNRLIERVRSGEARCSEGGPYWSNRIHRDDAAGSIVHLLRLERIEACYVGVDDEPAPICDVYRYLAGLLGVEEPGIRSDGSPRRSNKRCSNRRLRASGYGFAFPSYRAGYRALLEEV